MKKALALLLTAALVLSVCALPALAEEPIAVATTQTVLVDGSPVTFETYALLDANGNQTNYAKLRDVAHALNGSKVQFNVSWSMDRGVYAETGTAYIPNGSENTTPWSGDRAYTLGAPTTDIDGKAVALDAIVLTDDAGGGYTYYKLRDLGAALGFTVDWTAETGVFIDTSEAPAPLPDSSADAARLVGTWTGEMDMGQAMETALAQLADMEAYCHFTPAPVGVALTMDPEVYTLRIDETSLKASLDTFLDELAVGMLAYLESYAQEQGVSLDLALALQGTDREQLVQEMKDTVKEGIQDTDLEESGRWALSGNRLLTSESLEEEPTDSGMTVTFLTDDHIRLTAAQDGLEMSVDLYRAAG